ncbi:MAG TPA: hypothetical protein DGP25_02665 [Brevundimonas sp.]|jgi:hypothetical protein|uniref:ATP-dependent Clp protease proteolytic subunit n=1 Tax=Brevundimonas naejangsanensis TaxID=588932 RepID=UPI000EC34469|nr:hypothetical protein [Brevundimonas sp.]
MEQHLIYHGAVNAQGARNAEVLMIAALREGASRITFRLCSNGGDVTAGIGLFNFIRAFPIPVDVHAFGICGSVAATIILAGERRTTEPISRFSLHAASNASGYVEATTRLISDPFRAQVGWSDQECARYFSELTDSWLTPDEAKALRIVHSIEHLPLPADPARIVVVGIADA